MQSYKYHCKQLLHDDDATLGFYDIQGGHFSSDLKVVYIPIHQSVTFRKIPFEFNHTLSRAAA